MKRENKIVIIDAEPNYIITLHGKRLKTQNDRRIARMWKQTEFRLQARSRGFHLVTSEISKALGELPKVGLLHLFIKHTSAALTINENADPDVRMDMESIFNHVIKEREPYYQHTMEGDDDMPAHAKCSIIGPSVTIPITNGRLNLGTWQGIYLCEFRDYGGSRSIVATITGE